MQTTFAIAALISAVAAQGVTELITPDAPSPAGCTNAIAGAFEITAVNSTVTKRDLSKRTCNAEGSLTITLADGILKDAFGRTGYVADNYQFQFDGPPQAGSLFTGGFSVCGNGSLALGGSAIFYECRSGDFYNLYDRTWAPQCEPILIQVLPCGAASSTTSAGVGQISDGQPTGTAVASPVTQIGDGQIQGPSAIPISEIADGQPQVPTGLISQIGDGQVQKPTANPISQISDGQVQAPSATPTPTASPISQISDGQVQAPPTTSAPATTVAPVSTVIPITQISDGQIQAPNATIPVVSPSLAPTSSPSSVPDSAANSVAIGSSFAAVVVGFAAVLFL